MRVCEYFRELGCHCQLFIDAHLKPSDSHCEEDDYPPTGEGCFHREQHRRKAAERVVRLLAAGAQATIPVLIRERMRLMTVAYDLKDEAAEQAMIRRKAELLDRVGELTAALAAAAALGLPASDEGR